MRPASKHYFKKELRRRPLELKVLEWVTRPFASISQQTTDDPLLVSLLDI